MAQVTTRDDAMILMKPEQVTEIISNVGQRSVCLSRMKKLPNMVSSKTVMPILAELAHAYFVNGDTGLKQTTKMAWKGKEIHAEEIAVIVPFPEAVVADADYPITEEMLPIVYDAFAEVIDAAMLEGKGRPASWPEGLITLARNQGHIISLGAGNDDMYKKVMDVDGLLNQIEKDGFAPNGVIGSVRAKGYIRGLVNKDGDQLSMGPNSREVDGLPVSYVTNGAWTDSKNLLLAGDFTKAVYSIRQDITFKKFEEGVITDSEGKVLYNLMQNDMVAYRFVMRLGWNVANPVSSLNPDEATRFPLSLLTEADPTALTKVTFTVSSDTGSTKVKGATVAFGGLERTTSTLGTAKFDVPANAKGPWAVKKGDTVVAGYISNASEETAIAVNNFVEPTAPKGK